jgi:hypothetical protein
MSMQSDRPTEEQVRGLTVDQLIALLQAERDRLNQHIEGAGDLTVYLNDSLPVVAVRTDFIEGVGEVYMGLFDEDHNVR